MRTCVTILCVLAFLAPIGLADDISVGKLTYSGVTIVDVKAGMVIFKIPSGLTQSKAFSEITSISISGLDSFNKAEQLISETAGDSQAAKLRKEIKTRQSAVDTIKAQVADVPKEVKRLEDEAKHWRSQIAAIKQSRAEITKQLEDAKNRSAKSQGKVAKLKAEAIKLMNEAKAIERAKKGDWKNQANQRKKQAEALVKQVNDLDVGKLKYQARIKRAQATKLLREAKIIERAKKKDWQNQSKNRKNQANKLNREAGDTENKAKRLAEAGGKGRAKLVQLNSEIGKLRRDESLASRNAAKFETQAKAFPKTAKELKEKVVLQEHELDGLKAKLKQFASGPKIKPEQFPAAIRAYEAAAALRVSAHVKAIIDYRLLSALDRAGWIDQASSKWLRLADREVTPASVVACRPKTLAEKGDPRNAKAINILGTRLRGMKDKKYRTAALDLLAKLLSVEGRGDEIVRWLPKESADDGPKLKLLRVAALLNKKDYTKAETGVDGVLRQLDKDSLSEALSIRAKALLGQAGSETDKKKKQELMQKAGLDFMRVAIFFRGSPRAGESLFLAGQIMATLPSKPNIPAAINAYKAVESQYAGTAIGKKATIALKTLQARK
ncbi:MAG: hypothetical protein QGH60_19100 [Phycisphaerae bacterium]|jgi:hypothetical protein|nr:hypothetical protein [Phycisphaerae bacterium]